MSFNKDSLLEHFSKDETAEQYDATTGGVTKRLINDILSKYLESESLEGKVILDNACGTGVVTKELISRTGNITVEAADISPAMTNYLKKSISNEKGAKVTIKVMNAQVYPPFKLHIF